MQLYYICRVLLMSNSRHITWHAHPIQIWPQTSKISHTKDGGWKQNTKVFSFEQLTAETKAKWLWIIYVGSFFKKYFMFMFNAYLCSDEKISWRIQLIVTMTSHTCLLFIFFLYFFFFAIYMSAYNSVNTDATTTQGHSRRKPVAVYYVYFAAS